ncbi:hypothetical protein N7478_004736 [Penicillium angulare]|uniref:uncharacterized protein n=1 Tax=Penicillium angulare TaxID=116970 RepID=UPI002540078B|nr:uncharacterized protein N7478_004736 [Penicillium angulare]KAJ5279364.1 hypothetical protein N7478_004736 [Penicillium angulare]
MGKSKRMDDLCAVFVHAGAGYHSRENEKKHLQVCQLAVEAGMTLLRQGGTAVEAVEIAITVLEDAPITNAGYGSNLTEKGIAECDASIVDHYGRSGAAGAVPSVKNPIHLARRIYDQAYRAPGMSRVPPNFLCGEGATEFAWNNNILVLPNDAMIAPQARSRWRNWTNEIANYERTHPRSEEEIRADFFRQPHNLSYAAIPGIRERIEAARNILPEPKAPAPQPVNEENFDGLDPKIQSEPPFDVPPSNGEMSWTDPQVETSKRAPDFHAFGEDTQADDEDCITDTVGAIAVDKWGNIAAGSSSGGIGMKHRGRIGPAALIGIGTHVFPVDPTDTDGTAVAVVTSGTGEHIASTFAASKCAERLYYNQRMGAGGIYEQVTEEEAIAAMLQNEFSGHPAVLNSEIAGSIGLMAVKKTKDGIGLFFAHNTESFALASLSSCDTVAQCVMSRNPKRAPVAQGGLMIRPT